VRYFIGIDPGANGALVVLVNDRDSDDLFSMPFSKYTERDIVLAIDHLPHAPKWCCFIEKVHAMPKQGVSSTFKFGRSYGVMIGILTALGIPYREVTPQTWQKAMSCLSKGDKNVTKAAAQKLFPSVKVTHANADALLIAEYCRRTWV
jgi:Holliday junction resolvasome RuvABC endonuclease subunit